MKHGTRLALRTQKAATTSETMVGGVDRVRGRQPFARSWRDRELVVQDSERLVLILRDSPCS